MLDVQEPLPGEQGLAAHRSRRMRRPRARRRAGLEPCTATSSSTALRATLSRHRGAGRGGARTRAVDQRHSSSMGDRADRGGRLRRLAGRDGSGESRGAQDRHGKRDIKRMTQARGGTDGWLVGRARGVAAVGRGLRGGTRERRLPGDAHRRRPRHRRARLAEHATRTSPSTPCTDGSGRTAPSRASWRSSASPTPIRACWPRPSRCRKTRPRSSCSRRPASRSPRDGSSIAGRPARGGPRPRHCHRPTC